MTYQGKVQNGVVVFESTAPPEGTRVRVEAVIAAEPTASNTQTIWQKLSAFAGRAPQLPPDAALNHDHYLYGRPKR